MPFNFKESGLKYYAKHGSVQDFVFIFLDAKPF